MISIILVGACGRMGHQVAEHAADAGVKILAGIDVHAERYSDFPVYPSFDLCHETADAIIDFSRPEGLPETLKYATAHHTPAVLCTTGYNDAEKKMIEEAEKETAIFRSANMSMGMYVMSALCAQAAKILSDYDIEIVEKHHNQKVDAPSGSALLLLDAVKNANTIVVNGRDSRTEKRRKEEIGIHAVRGGTVTGVHEVGFYGVDETVTLTHTAQSRGVFAVGALKAAKFISQKGAGAYGMADLADELLNKKA